MKRQLPQMRFLALLGMTIGILTFSLACTASSSGGRVIGGQPMSIAELPTYPGATELKAGESKIVEPLFGPAHRETPPFIGLGIEVDRTQRDFTVPKETTFENVKTFYVDKLRAFGWREDPAMREFTNNANSQTENMQGAIWVRVDQTLLIVLATGANGDKELTLSMATH